MGNWYSEISLWFNRKFFIPGIKRYDSTAMEVANIRMTETLTEEEKRLFSDPYAKHFIIGAWAIEWMGAPLIKKKYDDLVPGLYSAVVARTRFLDDLCRDAEKSGCKQLVILGAG
eukprot:285300_1